MKAGKVFAVMLVFGLLAGGCGNAAQEESGSDPSTKEEIREIRDEIDKEDLQEIKDACSEDETPDKKPDETSNENEEGVDNFDDFRSQIKKHTGKIVITYNGKDVSVDIEELDQ